MANRRVLVCGSRDYEDAARLWQVLDAYYARIGPRMHVISGGARGADELARQWAVNNRVDHSIYYARWGLDGQRAAGPIRNRRMARKKPKLVLAFSKDFDNSRGTADMIRVAEKLNIKVKKFS